MKVCSEKSMDKLEIKVVESTDELLKAFLVRAIVYIHEQNCPFVEEFDKNDFTSTQIVGLINSEPILTARIRYIDSYAKFERLAIRPQYRGHGFGHVLLNYMISFAENKGYNKIILHAQKRLVPFYQGHGFESDENVFKFSGYEYLQMKRSCRILKKNSLLKNSPIVINRPENDTKNPGPLEEGIYNNKLDEIKEVI
jgi:predicted GNAT family N-acyltransferase